MECPCLNGLPGIILTDSIPPPPPIIISLVSSKECCGIGEARQEEGVEEEDIGAAGRGLEGSRALRPPGMAPGPPKFPGYPDGNTEGGTEDYLGSRAYTLHVHTESVRGDPPLVMHSCSMLFLDSPKDINEYLKVKVSCIDIVVHVTHAHYTLLFKLFFYGRTQFYQGKSGGDSLLSSLIMMISSPTDDAAEQTLCHIVQKTRIQNTAILIKSASCSPGSAPYLRSVHGDHRFPVLHALLKQCLHDGAEGMEAGKRIVISVQGKKDLETTCSLIMDAFKDDMHLMGDSLKLVHGLQGHADIVEFSRLWRKAFAEHRILLTTSQSLLFLFSHGLLRMDQLTHLFFDDCTMANANHPYCTVMKSFYLPRRAQLLKEALEAATDDEDVGGGGGGAEVLAVDGMGGRLPRILLFADWPLVKDGEDFLAKRDRISKMLQYLRLFQTVIRPLASELRAPEDCTWLAYEELIYLKDAGCFDQLQSIYLAPGQESLLDRLECIAEAYRGAENRNVLVLLQPDNLQPAARILERELGVPCELLSPSSLKEGHVLLHAMDEDGLALLAHYLQQQSPASLAAVYVAEAGSSPSLLLTLMAYAKQMPVVSIRSRSPASLQQQAMEMMLWMTAIGASSPVDSGPFRKLRAFIGGYEAVAQQAYLLATDSPIHHWIPASGALICTATSISMLLCCCSYLPHIESAGTGLRIHTMAVKRVTAEGTELDRDRHFYMTRITLPPCLQPWLGADEERRHIQGPLTPSRYSSQTLAANATLKLLHEIGVLDDHLMIAESVLKVLLGEETMLQMTDGLQLDSQNTHHQLEYNPFENEEIDGEGPSKIQELVPIPFQKGPEWTALEPKGTEHIVRSVLTLH